MRKAERPPPVGRATVQQVLDVALASSRHQPPLRRGGLPARTRREHQHHWNSHEPASILHHLVFVPNTTSRCDTSSTAASNDIKDYRWNTTAQGWARYGNSDEKMAQWLENAERQRDEQIPSSETRSVPEGTSVAFRRCRRRDAEQLEPRGACHGPVKDNRSGIRRPGRRQVRG